MAEGGRFELPRRPYDPSAGFQDRWFKPLTHPSVAEVGGLEPPRQLSESCMLPLHHTSKAFVDWRAGKSSQGSEHLVPYLAKLLSLLREGSLNATEGMSPSRIRLLADYLIIISYRIHHAQLLVTTSKEPPWPYENPRSHPASPGVKGPPLRP